MLKFYDKELANKKCSVYNALKFSCNKSMEAPQIKVYI